MIHKETRTASISYDAHDGLIFIVLKAVSDVVMEDVRTMMATSLEMADSKKIAVLIDSANYTQYSKEVRDYYASTEAAATLSAMAILVSDLPTRLIGNFFIKVHRPLYPTRLFNSSGEAVKWLKKITNKEELIKEP